MGNSKNGKRFSDEYKAIVVDFYKTHDVYNTAREFNVSVCSVVNWSKKLGFIKGRSRFSSDFKHEVCQYYDNHTGDETIGKFDVSIDTVCKWRRELGYRNKSLGYNLYMEGLQPTMQKRERRDFVITKMENGDLKGQIVELQKVVSDMSLDNQWLKDKLTRIADAIKTMEV
jgi:transposase-like protein